MNSNEIPFLQACDAEEARLAFILNRDGMAGMLKFIDQTHPIYCAAMVMVKNMASTREHQHKYFASCVVFETAAEKAKQLESFS